MNINACAIQKKGGNAKPFSYKISLRKDDVLVRITYCGIAKGDIQIINDDWGDTKFPVIPGHEIIGIVERVGKQVIGLKIGNHVGIGYQQKACFKCKFCKEGNAQFCAKQKVIGVDAYGGFAERIIVDYRFAFKLPSKLDSAKSIPLLSSGLTVYSAITKANLPGKSMVAVLGIGGLGQLAIQFLQKMGHKISAFSHSPQKEEMINQLGAKYIDSSDKSNSAKFNRKFDFILSTLNVDFNIDTYLKMLQPKGALCLVAQPLTKLSINLGLLYDYAQRTVYGNYTGSRVDMMNMIAFSAKHNIESNVEIMPLSKINEAIKLVRKGSFPTRIVLDNKK